MTEADKIEELAKTFDGTLSPIVFEDELEVATFLRFLSTKLKDLEEAKGALEWILEEHGDFLTGVLEELNPPDMPPYLKKRLGKEE